MLPVARDASTASGHGAASLAVIVAGVSITGPGTPNVPLSAADLRGRFVGRQVVVEPLAAEHEAGLVQAAVDAEMFQWMPVDMASSREALREWVATTLAAARRRTSDAPARARRLRRPWRGYLLPAFAPSRASG